MESCISNSSGVKSHELVRDGPALPLHLRVQRIALRPPLETLKLCVGLGAECFATRKIGKPRAMVACTHLQLEREGFRENHGLCGLNELCF